MMNIVSPPPPKISWLRSIFKNQPFTLLDAGAGNHSATQIKKYLPACRYFGIDITRDYSNDENDFRLMEGFWEKDLTKLDFEDIPDGSFDALMMAHIIEHLENGDEVIRKLAPKLKKDGYLYIEYPGEKSKYLPSKKGTLNFHDDPTHCRCYSVKEVCEILVQSGFSILSSGIRRDWKHLLIMPVKMIHNRIKYGYVMGSVYWDWYGFAEYVFARKAT